MSDLIISNEWIKTHCRTEDELYELKKEGMNDAANELSKLPEDDNITTTPYVVYADSFKTEFGFSIFMDIVAQRYKMSDEIVVRYSKPEAEDGSIHPCIQILRSKAKMFHKYMSVNRPVLSFTAKSNKELKEIAKKLNSFGVKDVDEESASDFILSHDAPSSFSLYYDDDLMQCVVADYDEGDDVNSLLSVQSLKDYFDENIFAQ